MHEGTPTDPIELHDPTAEVPTLLQHSLREEWGLGMITSREPDRVHLQFQDGLPRSFKRGYYHLFEAVDRRLDITLGIVDALQDMLGGTKKKTRRVRTVTLEEQVAFFGDLYEEGFVGEEYRHKHRTDGRAKPLKRHRDGLIATAKEELGKAKLQRSLAEGDPRAVFEAAGAVVSCTDLIKLNERKLFLAMSPKEHAAFANALFSLLHGRASFVRRFDDLVAALERGMGIAPSWELATLFSAALRPDKHTLVRMNTHARQAEYMAPGIRLTDRPMGIFYERLLQMSTSVQEVLEEKGYEPVDYFDVFEFMWQTLRPAAQKEIRANASSTSGASEDAAREAA